jgi:hypothetical protein
MTFPFQFDDGGRSKSKRPKQKNDCTVRALALATKTPYDEVYEMLAKHGRKCSTGIFFWDWLKSIGNVALDHKFERISFPAVKGLRRMNPVDFCDEHPRGTYICKSAGHAFAVIDGVVHDDHQTYDERCIYSAWWVLPVKVEQPKRYRVKSRELA